MSADTSTDVSSIDTSGVFDTPARWRAQAARVLGLRDDELIAAMSPGPACPAALESVLTAVHASGRPVELVVDVGAGVGGVGEWIRRRTGAAVVAVEPAAGARDAASALFPALSVRPGTAAATGLADDIADLVVLSGVLSLIDDVGDVLLETRRIARPHGLVAIADLFAAGAGPVVSGPNVFRSFEQVTSSLAVRGWTILEVGCGAPEPAAHWAAAAQRVADWVSRAHRDHPAFEAWLADQHHLRRHVDDGDVVGGCVVATYTAHGALP